MHVLSHSQQRRQRLLHCIIAPNVRPSGTYWTCDPMNTCIEICSPWEKLVLMLLSDMVQRRKWLAQIAELCERGGAPLDVSTSDVLAHSLEAATRAAPDAGTASLIKSLAARAMSEAAYFSTGRPSSPFLST